MTVNAEYLALIMFRARCEKIGISENDATCFCGEDHHQYMEYAEPIAMLVNEHDVEAREIAKYILSRIELKDIERISSIPTSKPHYSPPSRILP